MQIIIPECNFDVFTTGSLNRILDSTIHVVESTQSYVILLVNTKTDNERYGSYRLTPVHLQLSS